MKELTVSAVIESLSAVREFVGSGLDEIGCGRSARYLIDTAVEEIFVNISSYAYGDKTGEAVIRMETEQSPPSVTIHFIDSGKPYDPLKKPDPDIKQPLKERKRGGLGIFIVKKSMDDMYYEYKDGHNILTIKKTAV